MAQSPVALLSSEADMQQAAWALQLLLGCSAGPWILGVPESPVPDTPELEASITSSAWQHPVLGVHKCWGLKPVY